MTKLKIDYLKTNMVDLSVLGKQYDNESNDMLIFSSNLKLLSKSSFDRKGTDRKGTILYLQTKQQQQQ